MTFMSEATKRIPPGDKAAGPQEQGGFAKSDLPGFVNPIIAGKPDPATYIPEAAAGTEDAPFYNRQQAEELTKKKKTPAQVMYGEDQ